MVPAINLVFRDIFHLWVKTNLKKSSRLRKGLACIYLVVPFLAHPCINGPLPRTRRVLALLGLESCVALEHDSVGLEEAGDEAGSKVGEAHVLN